MASGAAQAGRNALNETVAISFKAASLRSLTGALLPIAGDGEQLKPHCGDARYAASKEGTKRTPSCRKQIQVREKKK